MTNHRNPTSPNGKPRPAAGRAGPRVLPHGIATTFEFAIRFNDWALALTTPITAAAIQERWGVSKATAYRYHKAYRAAKGGAQ
jgi:hypothetical protein